MSVAARRVLRPSETEPTQADLAKQAKARAELDAVEADADEHYRQPARKIAQFLKRWDAANAMALVAGVQTLDRRLRYSEGYREPDREVVAYTYVDEAGRETASAYPPGSYFIDPETGAHHVPSRPNWRDPLGGRPGAKVEPYRQEARARTEKGRFVPAVDAGMLSRRVNLPGLTGSEDDIHVGAGLVSKEG